MHIIINLFKYFTTGYYQITIGFNDSVYLSNTTIKEAHSISKLFLLYDCDYRMVINDAEQILLEYSSEKKININKLRYIGIDSEILALDMEDIHKYFRGIEMQTERLGRFIKSIK